MFCPFSDSAVNQIFQICENLFDRLPELLTSLEIEYVEYPNRFSFACPVHGAVIEELSPR